MAKIDFVLLLLLSLVPIALYSVSIGTQDWCSFHLLPGTALQESDDDFGWLAAPNWTRPLVPFNGTIFLGLTEFRVAGSSPSLEGAHKLTHCLKRPPIDGHTSKSVSRSRPANSNRGCTRYMASVVLVCVALSLACFVVILEIFMRQSEGSLDSGQVVYAGLGTTLSGICGMMGWAIFHGTFVADPATIVDILPVSPVGLAIEVNDALGPSQLVALVAWVMQLTPLAAMLLYYAQQQLPSLEWPLPHPDASPPRATPQPFSSQCTQDQPVGLADLAMASCV